MEGPTTLFYTCLSGREFSRRAVRSHLWLDRSDVFPLKPFGPNSSVLRISVLIERGTNWATSKSFCRGHLAPLARFPGGTTG